MPDIIDLMTQAQRDRLCVLLEDLVNYQDQDEVNSIVASLIEIVLAANGGQ